MQMDGVPEQSFAVLGKYGTVQSVYNTMFGSQRNEPCYK